MKNKGKSIENKATKDNFLNVKAKVDFACDFFFNVSFGKNNSHQYRFYEEHSKRKFEKPEESEITCYFPGPIENTFPIAATGKNGRILYVEDKYYDIFGL